jgi:hypothetical protein
LNPALEEEKQLDLAHFAYSGGASLPRFLAAFFVFLALILFVNCVSLPAWQPRDSRIQTWTTLAIADFLKPKNHFDLVFLGSSLMLTPLTLADTKVLNRTLDGATHHQSTCLEMFLKGQAIKTFNFALPGEMPSDAFLIEKLLLKDERAPRLVVYGVGPRDFLDNLLDSPAATDPFQWLTRLPGGKPDSRFYGKEALQQSNFVLGEVLFGGHQRALLKDALTTSLANAIDRLVPLPEGVNHLSSRNVHALLPQFEPMQIEVGECLFKPDLKDDEGRFVNNLAEYVKRYRTLNLNTFNTQSDFLDQFLQLSKERGERVLLVGMPVTSINRRLISDSTFALYENTLKRVSRKNQAEFLNLEASGFFSDSDFGDTVHLNSGGGIKMLALLAKTIEDDRLLEGEHAPGKGGAL